jgi:hypothetical protein
MWDHVILGDDYVRLEGRPATILRGVIEGIIKEVESGTFPADWEDWECALADIIGECVRAKRVLGDTDRKHKRRATWRKTVFKA